MSTPDPLARVADDPTGLREAALALVAAWEAEELAIHEFVATDSTTRIEWTQKEQLVKKAEAALRAALATLTDREGSASPTPSSTPDVEGLR